MFGLGPATRIYLAAGITDMRKGFEGLYGLVRDRLSCEPLSGHLFLFCNAQRNRLKVLVWDGSGLLPCTPDQRLCKRCGRETVVIGYEESSQLDVEPAKYFVLVTKREKRACRSCEELGVLFQRNSLSDGEVALEEARSA